MKPRNRCCLIAYTKRRVIIIVLGFENKYLKYHIYQLCCIVPNSVINAEVKKKIVP